MPTTGEIASDLTCRDDLVTSLKDDTESTSKPSSTREKAEARRQRILDRSRYRIEMVNGNTENLNLDSSSTEKSISWQKRRRHMKKSVMNVETKKSIVEEDKELSKTLVETSTHKGDDTEAVLDMKDTIIEDAVYMPSFSKKETISTGKGNDSVGTLETKDTSCVMDESLSPPSINTKKYLGVAKMRRKIIANKKASATSTAQLSSNEYPTNIITSPLTTSSLTSSRTTHKFPLTPIIINLVTVLCLFFVGVDVGLQNHPHQHGSIIQRKFIWDENRFTSLSLFGTKSTITTDIVTILQQDFVDDGNEFAPHPLPHGANIHYTKRKETIDPLFGIDLNEISSGSGFINAAGRIAIKFHRALTYLLLTIPRNSSVMLISLFSRLMAYPPIFMAYAIIIRYIGRHVFHGNIPDIQDMFDVRKGKKFITSKGKIIGVGDTAGGPLINGSSEQFNLSGVAKKFVSNFMSTHFPTGLLAYTIFQDVNNDMFIILSGFLIGVILPVEFLTSGIMSDEL